MNYDKLPLIEEMKEINRDPLPLRTENQIEELVKELMGRMTDREKIGQTYQAAFYGQFTYGPEFDDIDVVKGIRKGDIGSLIGLYDNDQIYQLQKIAVTETRLGIPLFFANDIIHGCRTGFPTNLAMAGSFNPELVRESAEVIAYESSHSGVNLTYSPMVDIVRDPRWGRVVESAGEDPYLGMQMAKAYVKGFEQDDLNGYDSVASCLKHFVGYGASEAGRDYNTVDFGERNLREIYLKPFQAGINAGSQMIMTAFNVYDGVPISANKFLLRDILRKECGFKGVTISDYTATEEIIMHKVAETKEEVARLCMKAGTDIEMISTTYIDTLEKQIASDPELKMDLEAAVSRILILKYRLGLFDNPYKNIYHDFEANWLKPEFRTKSLKMAEESIVLLENNGILPLSKDRLVALIGPYSKTNRLIGPWAGKAKNEDSVTFLEGMANIGKKVLHVDWIEKNKSLDEEIKRVIKATHNADVVLFTIGEDQWESGEAHSKTNINLQESEKLMLEGLINAGRKVVLVVFAGRPLIITDVVKRVDAVIYAWYLGSEMGSALANVIYGIVSPSAKLPISFPRSVGQIPIYYNHLNTGRPQNPENLEDFYKTRYLDSPNEPLYSFGYGLSYSRFKYENLRKSSDQIDCDSILKLRIDITNESEVFGKEVVQCYLEPTVYSVSRPIRQLIGFEKVALAPNETKTVTFTLKYEDFSYTNIDYIKTPENRKYIIALGSASDDIRAETDVITKGGR